MTLPLFGTWQHSAEAELDRPFKPYLRISGAYKCPRALSYAYQRIQPSDPPDQKALNIMAIGNFAEILIIRELHRQGWETDHTVISATGQLSLKIRIPDTDVTLTGHPDGICRHPEFTNNRWVTLECKSMSPNRAEETMEKGIAETYPGYITQIALYTHILHQQGSLPNPRDGVFAMMDREGYPMPPERVTWNPELVPETLNTLSRVIRETERKEKIARPYEKQSANCRFCDYHALCWGQPKTPESGLEPTPRLNLEDTPEIRQAALRWMELKPENDRIKQTLQQASDARNGIDILAEGMIAGYFTPRDEPLYDPHALARLVPADLLKQCRINGRKKKGFWVRSLRR